MTAGRGVMFDLDGVLVLSEHLWEDAWIECAQRFGCEWSPADTRACQGLSVPEWSAYLAQRTSGDPDATADMVIASVAAAYDAGRVSLIEGAFELVAATAARVPIALASSAPRRIIDTVMDTMGLGKYFSATVSSAEVPRGKPSPDVYDEAVRRLGVDPGRSLAVEDSSNGIRAAAAAGLTVIAVAHERYPIAPDAIALADCVQQSLDGVRLEAPSPARPTVSIAGAVMTYVFNAERGFKDDLLVGLTAAYGRYLRRVPDASAVMAVDAPIDGQVSVITGGGSGHFPAFAGLVGPGLCHGAVVGDVFTSPSSEQAYRCIRALDGGAGVLLTFGNYAGDVMHFGVAAERARAEGIDTRVVLVTDDVASAPRERVADRRGIAGGFWVFRAAAAAARLGRSIDEVERVARLANARTFSFGVAFGGCTFPGRSEPLFTVERGTMALGLGIHGEPGIDTVEWMPAERLAGVLVDTLLAERPAGATRARVLLNGLGSTKYEELFVLYGAVDRRLAAEAVEIVEPEVGEFVTSLDMAGCSLTLCWLVPELEPLLSAPAAAPGYRSGGSVAMASGSVASPGPSGPRTAAASPAPAHGQTAGAQVAVAAIAAIARAVAASADELGRLDSVAGDGDHGAGMERGSQAASVAAGGAGPNPSDVVHAAGIAFGDAAGGASGALWGAALMAGGRVLKHGEGVAGSDGARPPTATTVHAALEAALEAVTRLGGAKVGDKTLVDVLAPFVDAFGRAATAPASVARAWSVAVPIARQAAIATALLPGRKGRAAVHGDHSIGTPDPGAVSLSIALEAVGTVLGARCDVDAGRSRTSEGA